MTLYCCQYRQSALHCTCCSKLQFAHTQLYTDILIKFQIWKQPRKDGIYLLPGAYERGEGVSNCHIFVVPSSVEFSASKTRLIR